MMDERLLGKIQKLLSLSDGSSFKEEADSALDKAYRLLSENGLTMLDVDGYSREKKLGPLCRRHLNEKWTRYAKWEINLLAALGELFNCSMVMSKNHDTGKGAMYIIGRQGNTVTTELMYNWIRSEARKEARNRYGLSKNRTSYCLGIAKGVNDTVNRLKKHYEDNLNASCTTGLTLYDESRQYMNELYGHLEENKTRRSSVMRDAYASGIENGRSMNLNRQINTTGIESA